MNLYEILKPQSPHSVEDCSLPPASASMSAACSSPPSGLHQPSGSASCFAAPLCNHSFAFMPSPSPQEHDHLFIPKHVPSLHLPEATETQLEKNPQPQWRGTRYLDSTKLSETSETEEDKNHMMSLTCGL